MKLRQLNETIDYILEGEDEAARMERGLKVGKDDPTFITFMQLGTNPDLKLLGLPEGSPDTYKPDIHAPEGIADTTARQELRRIKSFIPGGSYNSLKPTKAENVWIQILEGIHWREALILTMIKDQTVLENYPNLLPVLEGLGVVACINKNEEVPTKPRGRPKKNV